MHSRLSTVALLSFLASSSLAHFDITYPDSIQGSEDNLDKGPCGGAEINFDSGPVTDFHIGGNAVALDPSHPQSTWLFRVTTDMTGEGNWTKGYPIVLQSGLGTLCMTTVTAPEDFVGKKGLVGVVAHAEDGVLYGCAQVTFVEGTGDMPETCKNTTQNISFTDDKTLDAMVGEGSSSTSDQSPSGTSSTPDSTDTPGLAATLRSGPAGLGAILVTTSVAVLVGASLML